MSDYGFTGNGEMADLQTDPVADYGLGKATLPPIQRAPEFPSSRREALPRSTLQSSMSGIGILDDVTTNIASILNTSVLGIPLWVIGLGVGGYFMFCHKPQKSAKRSWSDNEAD